MEERFRPYEGKEPYIFISYARKDKRTVLPIIEAMSDAGYRIWYDEALHWTEEWPDEIAAHLAGSAVCLAFHSKASAASPHCKAEIHFARSKERPILSVYLEDDVQLPLGTEMYLGLYQSVKLSQFDSPASLADQLGKHPVFAPCKLLEQDESKEISGYSIASTNKKSYQMRHFRMNIYALLVMAFLTISLSLYISPRKEQEDEVDKDSDYSQMLQDIPEESVFYNSAYWALEEGISFGTSGTTFSPYDPCSKRTVLTFLWRILVKRITALGLPVGYDFDNEAYEIYNWACRKGMESYGFDLSQVCTRAEIVRYLWVYSGRPYVDIDNIDQQFVDVDQEDDYAQAAVWAVENDITDSYDSKRFHPEGLCTRAAVVNLLYRYLTYEANTLLGRS